MKQMPIQHYNSNFMHMVLISEVGIVHSESTCLSPSGLGGLKVSASLEELV